MRCREGVIACPTLFHPSTANHRFVLAATLLGSRSGLRPSRLTHIFPVSDYVSTSRFGLPRPPTVAMPMQPLHALVVATGLRPGSKTATAARFVAERLAADAFSVDLIDLAHEPLPLCDGAACYGNEQVVAVTRRVEVADLVALCFPVYNYQPNAAAKNFVEVTNSAWKDKVVTFVANAGGDRSFLAPLPLANALMVDHRCVIVPQFLYLSPAAFDATGSIVLDPLAEEIFEFQIDAACRLAAAWVGRPARPRA